MEGAAATVAEFVRMADFSRGVAEWHNFYLLLGGCTATLAGLLFVALSIDSTAMRRAGNEHLTALASVSFYSYLHLLFISLVMVTPVARQTLVASWLALVGSALAVRSGKGWLDSRAALSCDPDRAAVVRGYVQPFGCAIGFLVIAVLLLARNPFALIWMLAPTAGLLISATRNAWTLLTLLGRRGSVNSANEIDPELAGAGASKRGAY